MKDMDIYKAKIDGKLNWNDTFYYLQDHINNIYSFYHSLLSSTFIYFSFDF